MATKASVERFAHYNRWMNERVYATAANLSHEALQQDRHAFFGSIMGTLNHLMVADTIWLKRFTLHPRGYTSLLPVTQMPTPGALSAILHDTLPALTQQRVRMDSVIEQLCQEIEDEDLGVPLAYRNMKGQACRKIFGDILQHFFNHQTHHRGQLSTLLFQAGQDVGVTDLLVLIPDIEA